MQIMKTHIDQINEAEQLQIDAINQELPFNQNQEWVQNPY
jgi:hypothetical protein